MRRAAANSTHIVRRPAIPSWLVGASVMVMIAGGCATARPMPQVNLEAPGWSLWTGQAVWQPPGERPRVAGELVAARNVNGDVLVSFSKPPFPVFTAQTAGSLWRLDITGRRSYGGSGRPPKRFVWFWLPAMLDGGPAPGRWQLERPFDDELLLVNQRSGESIRVVLD
jgi:hypothetical protein